MDLQSDSNRAETAHSASYSEDELINILLVDDEPKNLTVLQSILEDPGYRLVCAESAEQALLALVSEEFALLVIDIQMPDMSGFELAQMIKQRKKTAGIPIIFLTAYYSEDRHVLEGYCTGAVDYLHKPINPLILRSKVAVFAELYRKSRETSRINRALLTEVTARRNAEEQLRELNQELERRVADRTTELVRANTALSESQQRLRLALQAGHTGVWDWEFATNRLTWSEESYAIHALQPGAFEETIEAFKRLVHDHDRARVSLALISAIDRGETYTCEFRIVRPDGAVRWVTHLGTVQYDDEHRPVAMTGTITDITDRRAAEQTLLEREREMRSLADNTPDILTRFDERFRYVFVNSAIEKATGLPRDKFLGSTMRDLAMPADLCEQWEQALRSVFETKKQTSIEFEYQGPGGLRQYATRLVPEFRPSGVTESVLGVTQDITERRCAEEALKQADRRKDEFLATLAHELRNPLAPIRTGLQVLKLSEDASVTVPTREMMERQLSHMVRLIDDLLDVSRITRGKVTLRQEEVLLGAVLEIALEASRPVLEASKHSLELAVSDEPVWLNADPMRLAQVVTNLLTNAAKYTPAGGSVKLAAVREGGDVIVQVTDSGLGIPPTMLSEVFEMFTQVNRTLDRAQGGLGIGLALVKRLVEFHGGTITAASPGLGLGSTFTVRLPVLQIFTKSNQSQSAPAARPVKNQSYHRRVLVVDDNVDGAESLARMLQISGHEMRVAYSGPEALHTVRSFTPEVVFLDIGLPGMNGYEVAKRLRAELSPRRAVLVALTGWGSQDDKRQSKEAGFDFHLTKPVELTAIENILARAV
jgi:PAS domain S-box-containing protein